MPPSTEDILAKYSKKIETQLGNFNQNENYSREYVQFKKEMMPEMTRYRNWCNALGNIVKIKINEKDRVKIQRHLSIAHLDVTPAQSVTLAIVAFLLTLFLVSAIGIAMFFISGTIPLIFAALGLISSLFIFYHTYGMPKRLANAWRLKASSQMVPAVLYTVVYMKHTSNLERAIEFTSQHLSPPLSLDFKKVFYDVETGRYSSIKQSLDEYLETWRDYAPEFIESFHLIESSLYEPSEANRVRILEKALQVILDGIYEKMNQYSREIRSPLINIYMLGIMLPTLGLTLLPLASALLQGAIQWFHVVIIFNVIVPFFVYYMISEVLLKRPGGHGESSALELNPNYPQYKSKKPWLIAGLIALPLLIISLLPFIFQIGFITDSLNLQSDYTFKQLGSPFFENEKIFDFKVLQDGSKVGPFGLLGTILSFLFPLSIMLFFTIAYRMKTAELMKSRNETKELESEFANSLFQLGNRLGDGHPAEISFIKVAESTKGQKTQKFFSIVNQNVQQFGMSIDRAIFDPKRGAIIYYPSALIATSMRILVESVKKGLKVASRSLMAISEYMKNIKKINERLQDLVAEIISDMKSNMLFVTPLLAGIVVGLAVMMTSILNKLKALVVTQISGDNLSLGGFGSITDIVNIFDIDLVIPPYFVQVIIGIYLIEITFILTRALVTIDAGKDSLREKYELSKNLLVGSTLYFIAALGASIALFGLSSVALGALS